MCATTGALANDPASIGVDDECHVDEPRAGRDVSKSDTHRMFGAGARNCRFARSSEHGAALLLMVVRTGPATSSGELCRRSRRPTPLLSSGGQRSSGRRRTLPAVAAARSCGRRRRGVLLEHAPHLRSERIVAQSASRPLSRLNPCGSVGHGRRKGDRQNPAYRLEPINLTMCVNERHHHLARRSSSAIAKYADALRRISLA
jgi:hypothetical protein